MAASLKAFSTDLLQKLDLQCERFEFGPEVAAKLSRTGEKIDEVPICYQRRPTRRSKIFEPFARRSVATNEHGIGRKPAVKKHQWNDGLHALDTLWKWRYWTMPVPDPDRIPAAVRSTAVFTKKPIVDEKISAAVQINLDLWAEADAKRSDFDEAVWNDSASSRSSDAVEKMVEDVLTVNAKVREGRSVVAAAIAAAAANFEPRLVWERFAKKSTTRVGDAGDTDRGEDWEHWGLTDLLLMLAIVNIGLLLLVTMVTLFSSWSGVAARDVGVGGDVSHDAPANTNSTNATRHLTFWPFYLYARRFPSSWIWRDRTMVMLAAAVPAGGTYQASLARHQAA